LITIPTENIAQIKNGVIWLVSVVWPYHGNGLQNV